MKPNSISAKPAPKTFGPVKPTAKVITHPNSKMIDEAPSIAPPDEETLQRLNAMAKQHPFCIRHKGRNNFLL
jgi:hypothetical protein